LSELTGVSAADVTTVVTLNLQHAQALQAGAAIDDATATTLLTDPTNTQAAAKAVQEIVAKLHVTQQQAVALITELRSIPVEETRWAPSELVLEAGVPVVAGRRYALVISAPASTVRGYGMAYSDADPYPRGGALVSSDGGATWREEAGRDLKFETSVEEATP